MKDIRSRLLAKHPELGADVALVYDDRRLTDKLHDGNADALWRMHAGPTRFLIAIPQTSTNLCLVHTPVS